MQVRGIDFTPLILGKVKLGNIHKMQRELLIEELFLRLIVVPSNEKITVIWQRLIADEYNDQTADDNTKNHIMMKLHTAAEWSKDAL